MIVVNSCHITMLNICSTCCDDTLPMIAVLLTNHVNDKLNRHSNLIHGYPFNHMSDQRRSISAGTFVQSASKSVLCGSKSDCMGMQTYWSVYQRLTVSIVCHFSMVPQQMFVTIFSPALSKVCLTITSSRQKNYKTNFVDAIRLLHLSTEHLNKFSLC